MKGKLFFEGKWQQGEEFFPVKNPVNREVIWEFPIASLSQIERAISFIHKHKNIVKSLTPFERSNILLKARDILENKKEEMAKTISLESGKTINEARMEVRRGIETLEFTAQTVRSFWQGEYVPFDASQFGKNKIGFYFREPLGVVAAITPFNFPLNLALHKIAPAFGAGNAFVFKPSSYTPGTGMLLFEIFLESGVPEKCISFLTGPGNKVGNPIVMNEYINAITFTGSLEVGKKLAGISNMKKLTLELGSNSACVVFKDSDWKNYIDRMLIGAYSLAGQVCISVQRVYVEEDIEQEFVALWTEKLQKLKVGDPLKEDTDIGPMIDEYYAKEKEEWLKEIEREGVSVIPQIKRDGNFLYPCIVRNAPENSKVCKKEVFAPLVVINSFKTEDEVIKKVNDSEYGLQCGVFTRDINRAFKFFKEIEVGGVIINDIPSFRVDLMPYGGVKGSGMGREGPKFAIQELSEIKLLVINTA